MNKLIIILAVFLACAFPLLATAGNPPEVQMHDISQTVLKMGLAEGVSGDDAADAMRSKAAELNMKLVGHQNVGLELQNRGVDSPGLRSSSSAIRKTPSRW